MWYNMVDVEGNYPSVSDFNTWIDGKSALLAAAQADFATANSQISSQTSDFSTFKSGFDSFEPAVTEHSYSIDAVFD